MKVKVSKSYTLESVSHEDLQSIVKALDFYKRTYQYEDLPTVERLLREFSGLIDEHGDCRSITGVGIGRTVTISGSSAPTSIGIQGTPATVISNFGETVTSIRTFDEARSHLKRLRPFEGIMIPNELFPNLVSNTNVMWFAMGKSKQLNVSVWPDRESFDREEKAKTTFYINKHCADLLRIFLASNGTFTGKYTKSVLRGNTWKVDCYINNKGIVASDKTFILEYDTITRKLRIIKDGIDIVLKEIEKICLSEFLNSHEEES